MKIAILATIFPLLAFSQLANYQCDPSICKLPSCRCASANPPVQNPPQFLLLTFDDSIAADTYPQAKSLYESKKNPNGCPALTTWYAQVWWTDPRLASEYHAYGNEIGDHSVTHGLPSASSYDELEGMRAWYTETVNINRGSISGVRFPFLNYSISSLENLAKMGFTYDSSLAASLGGEEIWPYTLDNGVVTDCSGILSVCGKKINAPGLWEIPMITFKASDGSIQLMDPFNMPSLDRPFTPSQVTESYKQAFDNHYNSPTKVPFGVYVHPTWLGSRNNGAAKHTAVDSFLTYALSKPNVWMVTGNQLIEYMKNPVSADQLGAQPYMQCAKARNAPTGVCNGRDGGASLVENCSLPNGTIGTCFGCPSVYPSLEIPNPPKVATLRCKISDTCDALYWDPIGCKCLCANAACEFKDSSRPIQLGGIPFTPVAAGGGPGVKAVGPKTNGSSRPGNSQAGELLVSSLVFGIVLILTFF